MLRETKKHKTPKATGNIKSLGLPTVSKSFLLRNAYNTQIEENAIML